MSDSKNNPTKPTELTWAAFKAAVEKLGVKDDHIVYYIDVCSFPTADDVYVGFEAEDDGKMTFCVTG